MEVILFKSLRVQLLMLVAAGIVACLLPTAMSRASLSMQSAATRQALAAQGIGSVGGAIGDLDGHTQQNVALVEQSAAAAGSLQSQADDLVKLVSTFRVAAPS